MRLLLLTGVAVASQGEPAKPYRSEYKVMPGHNKPEVIKSPLPVDYIMDEELPEVFCSQISVFFSTADILIQ